MKKKGIIAIISAAALSVGVLCSGCISQPVGIKSIEKTGTRGAEDIYTITYTDGSTFEYTVKNGIDAGVSVKTIEKTATLGEEDIYTITMTNGTTSTFSVKNGKDGKDVTVEDVYETYKSVYGDISYAEFCEKYLSLNGQVNIAESVSGALLSSTKVFCGYTVTKNVYDFRGELIRTVTQDASSKGSGVVYRMEEDYTYILTNYHVVYASGTDQKLGEEIYVYMYGSESTPTFNDATGKHEYDSNAVPCEYVGGAIEYDVAVLRTETGRLKAINPQVRAVAVCEDYEVGESVFAVGNTEDHGIGVTAGVISVDRESINLAIDNKVRKYNSLRTDAMISYGNSGGGLFNTKGEMIALNHAGDTSITFINNAIPATVFKSVADGIIHYSFHDGTLKATKKLQIGVTVIEQNAKFVYDPLTAKGNVVSDVIVESTVAGGIAESLGIREGDRIISVTINSAEYAANRMFDIGEALLNVRVGDSVSLTYERGGARAVTSNYTAAADDLKKVS